ncbi:MAG: polysaccharide deacetylase family protein [Candidatus Sumerlaeaceae bacterium]|nr:polysaccharide deacetylase family protein [Candidatus Sumerlaeaceae bacterium]
MSTFAQTYSLLLEIEAEVTRTKSALSRNFKQLLLVYGNETDLGAAESSALEAEFDFVIQIPDSGFFGDRFLESPDLPHLPELLRKAATSEGFRELVGFPSPKVAVLGFDLIASAFWFLTRYEEYVNSTPDQHGRFLCEHSLAPPELYDQPVVNRWFENLYSLILEGLKIPKPAFTRRQTVALTHDVDLMRKYRGLRGARRFMSDTLTMRSSAEEVRHASMVLAGLRRDPYDSFDQLFQLKEKLGAQSTFFFMAGGKTGHDCDYSLADSDVRQLMSRVRSNRDEIALHPSYETLTSPALIRSEAETLRKEMVKPLRGSRQHYLRFAVPETWRALVDAGIRYDSSLGFADRAGFRCGWSGCFHPFDLEKREVLPIIEIPLVVMDVSLAVYEKVPAEQSLERLAHLLDASHTEGGAYVLLWHNIMNDRATFPGYWDTLEYFIFAAAGSARFITLNNLCDEFEHDAGN